MRIGNFLSTHALAKITKMEGGYYGEKEGSKGEKGQGQEKS